MKHGYRPSADPGPNRAEPAPAARAGRHPGQCTPSPHCQRPVDPSIYSLQHESRTLTETPPQGAVFERVPGTHGSEHKRGHVTSWSPSSGHGLEILHEPIASAWSLWTHGCVSSRRRAQRSYCPRRVKALSQQCGTGFRASTRGQVRSGMHGPRTASWADWLNAGEGR